MFSKIFRGAMVVAGAWLIIGGTIFIFIPAWRADIAFTESSYNWRIDSIEFRTGHRGHAHVKLDTGWYLLNIDEMKLVPYIQPGDSVVKNSGSRMIQVFRRTGEGLSVKEFD